VAIYVEKSCLAEAKLFGVALHKSMDPESVNLFAGFPHVTDEIFNGS
jgi:hypothetical protein